MQGTFPDNSIEEEGKKKGASSTILCLPYDLPQVYAFFCARYGNMTYKELLDMGYEEFEMKMASLPESEPMFNIIKSRAIKIEKLKDKDERKYWRELKEMNRIPAIYLPTKELNAEVENKIKSGGIGKWKKN